MRSMLIAVSGVWLMAAAAAAQPAPEGQTLEGIRTELQILRDQIGSLQRELQVADPATTGVVNAAPLLERAGLLEEEVRRLTAQVEALRFRIDSIVADGTNRIGDLEFRLTELEGGDFSTLGETVPLGEGAVGEGADASGSSVTQTPGSDTVDIGALRPILRSDRVQSGQTMTGAAPSPQPARPSIVEPQREQPLQPTQTQPDAPQLAIAEREAYEAALAAFNSGDFGTAAQGFRDFLTDYPGGPLAGVAAFWRGEALAAQGDWSNAARSYLDSFSGSPDGPKGAESLYRLGVALGRIGQVNEACLTLSEVAIRYPGAPAELQQKSDSERRALSCN